MPRLTPCPSCKNHILSSERDCPHCGAPLRTTMNPAAPSVLLGLGLGLTLAGCPTAEPAYGVPDSTTADTGSETASETGTGTGDTTDATADTGEAEYGVPDTGFDTGTGTDTDTGADTSAGEPDYGVPDTSTG